MKWIWVLAASFLCSAFASGQAIPTGTLIPVSLDGTVDARKAQPGKVLQADVMQDIPGTHVKRRARLLGHVIDASPNRLAFAFDAIEWRGQRTPLKGDLRAVASFLDVEEAQTPEESMDRGITPETATTTQIGGEQVYRGGGPVASGETVVGQPTPWGVLGMPRTHAASPCRGAVNGNAQPQAFWVFSTDACGVYGYSDLRIQHAGRRDPVGTIVLTSSGDLKLRSGTGMLLRVVE